jgi:two-component system chemotaxis response regulator CheY
MFGPGEIERQGDRMTSLIVDDDFASRMVIQRYLLPFGSTDVATDGAEAVSLFRAALEKKQRYDLVCLDIMLPEKSGQTVLKEVRQLETEFGVPQGKGARIIMVSALGDRETVMEAIQRCDAYLVKPIQVTDLVAHLKRFGLV